MTRPRTLADQFLRDPESAAARDAIRQLYSRHGLSADDGDPPADFVRSVMRLHADETISDDERRSILQDFSGLDSETVRTFDDAFRSMFYVDHLNARLPDHEAPVSGRYAAERILTHPASREGMRNEIEYAIEQHGDPTRENTRPINSHRHLAVRDAVDKSLGSRPLVAADNTEMTAFAEAEAAEGSSTREPTLRDTLSDAWDANDNG
jgi:hypothetical protein